MALKFQVESLDGIEASQRGLYAQKGDVFELQVEGLPDVDGLTKALSREREDHKKTRTALKGFEGVDPEEYKTLKGKQAEIEQQAKIQDGKLHEVVQTMQKEFEKEREAFRIEREALVTDRDGARKTLKLRDVEAALEKEYVKAKGKPEYLDDLKLRADLFDVFDGKVLMRDDDGSPKRHPKEALRFYEPADYVADMGKQKPGWFEGSGGGGSNGGRTPGPLRGVIDRNDQGAVLANLADLAAGKVNAQ